MTDSTTEQIVPPPLPPPPGVKPWYLSKGKVGAVLLALGALVAAVGGAVKGDLTPLGAFTQAWPTVTVALSLFGIRAALD